MLSKRAEYALRAVVFLAGQVEPRAADSVAEHTKVPRRFLNRVLQDLVVNKILISRSGPGGGYSLAQSSQELTILDVVNAVSPLARIRSCPLGIKLHEQLCPLHKQLDQVYEAAEVSLSKVTIEELLRSTSEIEVLCKKN